MEIRLGKGSPVRQRSECVSLRRLHTGKRIGWQTQFRNFANIVLSRDTLQNGKIRV